MPIELLCRICEELVSSELIEEHSKTCAINTKKGMRAIHCDDKINKVTNNQVTHFLIHFFPFFF